MACKTNAIYRANINLKKTLRIEYLNRVAAVDNVTSPPYVYP